MRFEFAVRRVVPELGVEAGDVVRYDTAQPTRVEVWRAGAVRVVNTLAAPERLRDAFFAGALSPQNEPTAAASAAPAIPA